jgi:5-methylcytosine-specific restriction endonuclease McrA
MHVVASEKLVEVGPLMTTGEIRHILYVRQGGRCKVCDKYVTEKQAHMNEKVPRGKGGKISLDNSEIICYFCHMEVNSKWSHGDRKPKFGGGKSED